MTLDLRDCDFAGPAMPEPFVKFRLEDLLARKKLLTRLSQPEVKKLKERWDVYRRKLRALGEQGGELRVQRHVLDPLLEFLGWSSIEPAGPVVTREGEEDGGVLLRNEDGTHLRAWVVAAGTDLDAPNRRGRAYRFSPGLVAQRVLLNRGERVGLLTDGLELRILLSDPSGRDSHIGIRLDRSSGWRSFRDPPDSLRLLIALCQPKGLAVIGELLDEARLSQTTVTKKLREQTRRAVENFLQGILDDPSNTQWRWHHAQAEATPATLWREGLVLVYRLLFILKLESAPDPARCFSFASASLWRRSFSPSVALAPFVREILDNGADTGNFLASSLRALFKMFAVGLESNEMVVKPLDGLLFGPAGTPTLDGLHWSERAVAELLDALLWTPAEGKAKADAGRERVHYGSLDVEDLGRVYEALLELEPGISTESMCRLRRAKLEVVVPRAQGEPYRKLAAAPAAGEDDEDEPDEDEDEGKGKSKTKVVFIEDIPANRFFLRVGLGRKSSGSYYTPHAFVRFLVEETLGPQVRERSPQTDPQPLTILGLKVLDPAMGSGHFLVEACRYLGDALYEACRLCDERAKALLDKAEAAKTDAERARLTAEAQSWWARCEALPDPNDEIMAYLPSRILDAHESGVSQRLALSICRRLVAVHCLYGVDKNPLAVELARVSLWLESYAEGWPLTFLDHRLIQGDSLTGPFFEHLLTYPGSGEPIDDLFAQGLSEALTKTLADALVYVRDLEATVGKDLAEVDLKRRSKEKLDDALAPFRLLAQAWAGGVMMGKSVCPDETYKALVEDVVRKDNGLSLGHGHNIPRVSGRIVPYSLAFPEVFYPDGNSQRSGGFDVILGNPPWDRLLPADKEFFAAFDLRILDAPTKKERDTVAKALQKDSEIQDLYNNYLLEFRSAEAVTRRTYGFQHVELNGERTIGKPDAYRLFIERSHALARDGGRLGLVVPSGFHANEGATGVRKLLLDQSEIECCFSFENLQKLFDIHRQFKFAAIVAKRQSTGTRRVLCAFYRHDEAWLGHLDGALTYERPFINVTGGGYLTFLELRTKPDHDVASQTFEAGRLFARFASDFEIRMGRELNMTDDAWRFTQAATISKMDSRKPDVAAQLRQRAYLPLHEGKTFHQFDDRWGDPPRYLVALESVNDKPNWTGAARFYRVAYRDVSNANNERTGIFCLLPPGCLTGNTAPIEREPARRPTSNALVLISSMNSFCFDWHIRQKGNAHVNLFILNGCPVPKLDAARERFLAHAALRLSCNHAGYAPLWTEQLSATWREPAAKHTWPALTSDARAAVRAAIDAVIADAYGLTREQFVHVLSSFNHKSYPDAPERCLAAFDQLKADCLTAFLKRHDPYHDIPLVTTLPKPVLDLPAPAGAADESFILEHPEPPKRKGAKKGTRA